MSRLNIFLLITIIGLLIFANTEALGSFTQSQTFHHIAVTPTIAPTPTPIAGIPKRLIIPEINIDTTIDSVGVDENGAIEVPHDYTQVGWYSMGYRPGEWGKAAIDGHLDMTTGAPAIFWNLHLLEPGDQIQVIDDRNKTYTFVVTSKQAHDYNNFPLEELIGSSDKKILNLVTCTGWWNAETHNYSHRMLISSEFVSIN